MRQYAWYSPELDVIVLQTIMEGCHISFEWGYEDLYEVSLINSKLDPMEYNLWIPLGEL